MKRVLVVGAGFGGLSAARRLAETPGVEVTLIDKINQGANSLSQEEKKKKQP